MKENGEPAAPGESGELIITDLDNYGMPFIRYRIGDIGVLSDRKCDCGRGLPILEKVEGRTFDIIMGTNGRHLGGTFWTLLLRTAVDGIKQFQVVQESKNEINIKIVVDEQFKTEYIKARILFILFIIESLFITMSSIFTTIATSREERDLYAYGKELMKTPLFKIPLIRLARGIFSIILGSLTVYILFIMGVEDPILLALPYPVAWFISSIPYTIYTYKQAIKKSHFSIPWRDLLIALLAGSMPALSLHLLNYDELIIRSFWNDLPGLLIATCLGISIYIAMIYLLSSWVREFINLGVSYISRKISKSN